MKPPPDFILFLGRFHVLLLHLPIGLILLLGILELLSRFPRFKEVRPGIGPILALAAIAAVVSAGAGYLLSLGGGYEPRLLQLHLWMGLGTAIAACLAGALYWAALPGLYRLSLGLTVGLLVVASHYGGSLTHGSDHLTRYAPEPLRKLLGGSSVIAANEGKSNYLDGEAYLTVAKPILEKYCVNCHGPEKAKGNLRLDTYNMMLGGGDLRVGMVPGKVTESSIIEHLRMPIDMDEHMPPDAKPQPSEGEIALLEWWISAGAPEKTKLSAMALPEQVVQNLASRLAPAPVRKSPPPAALLEVLPVSEKLAAQLNIAISPLAATGSWLQVNAAIAGTKFGNAELARLAPLGPNIRWLELAGTRVDDEGLATLTSMQNLERLHLQRTAITDKGLAVLSSLPHLEYLNLYGTEVTDSGLNALRQVPNLRRAYLWQTKVTPEAAKAFVVAKTDAAKIRKLEGELEQLKAQIAGERVTVELGAATVTNAAATNKECPVSGKPVDSAQTATYEGKLVAFCCADCKAKFQQDPKPFLAKLNSK